MKKLFQISAAFFGILMAQNGYSDTANPSNTNSMSMNQGAMMQNRPDQPNIRQNWQGEGRVLQGQGRSFYPRGQNFQGQGGSCGPQGCCAPAAPADRPVSGAAPCDSPTGECYCMYVHYEPCYYCTPRCVEEQIPCQKKCWRYVPKYYEVERCRYVPQYYKETYCRQEPECYYVQDCKTCKKIVYDQQCQYVPQYYWKHTCGNPCGNACGR